MIQLLKKYEKAIINHATIVLSVGLWLAMMYYGYQLFK